MFNLMFHKSNPKIRLLQPIQKPVSSTICDIVAEVKPCNIFRSLKFRCMANDTGKSVHLCLKRPQHSNAKCNVQYDHQNKRYLLKNRFSNNHKN